MAQRTVQCAKLGRELPGLDETTPQGSQALRMALLLGGPELRDRIRDQISEEAWGQWREHMRMVINEYRLDPTSDESNAILREHLEDFLFGAARPVRNYVPPKQS
ncbi:MAG: Fe(2+)-trafficking protein [Planctomycetota bacterium]